MTLAFSVWDSPPMGTASVSSPAELPIIRGSAGLLGRPRVRPFEDDSIKQIGEDEEGEPVYAQKPASGRSLPSDCLRGLTLPPGRHQCMGDYCQGRQRDGSCLADLARSEQEAGRTPEFMIDPEGFWTLKV